ncbi:MAG TPA: single-stranded DNA-binding protein [Spirochaetia bacterium]|nr:single-stranded DNA-binding protein [Spirochaetia bacterium]
MLNKVILIGRLTRDPELRYTQSGVAVANMTVAVDRNFSNRQGEKETDFIDVVVWRKLAETVANHLQKGRLVAVEGSLQIEKWEKDGVKHRNAKVVADGVNFLDRAKADGNGSQVRNEDGDEPPIDEDRPW